MSSGTAGWLRTELAAAGAAGLIAAFVVTPKMMGRIDEMLVTFLSIILAAVIPGIALTSASARPPVDTPLQARSFGTRLSAQVSFWFGFLWTGGLTVALILAGRALEWQITTPRFEWTPVWVPRGHAWLISIAMAGVVFVAIRARHVVTAVQSLIQVGTDLHAHQVEGKARQMQDEVRRQLDAMPKDDTRGSAKDYRPRH